MVLNILFSLLVIFGFSSTVYYYYVTWLIKRTIKVNELYFEVLKMVYNRAYLFLLNGQYDEFRSLINWSMTIYPSIKSVVYTKKEITLENVFSKEIINKIKGDRY